MKTYTDINVFFKDYPKLKLLNKKGSGQLDHSLMPFKVTKYYADIIDFDEENSLPLLNIIIPPFAKQKFTGRIDPYGNRKYKDGIYHFIQHKYKKTLLFHLVDSCWTNCQFCYKANEIRHERNLGYSLDQRINYAIRYIKKHKEIDNVLISGGDPFVLRGDKLAEILSVISVIDHVRVIRIATKTIVFNPKAMLNKTLIRVIKDIHNSKGKQVTIIAQINHPAEITDDLKKTVLRFRKIGVQFRGQPTLAKGINDNIKTLISLQRQLLNLDIISYYLTIFMPVRGVEQYALPLDRAYLLVSKSKLELNGLEKKGLLIASHELGKFEICGFLPTISNPEKIILKWHQSPMVSKIPREFLKYIPCKPENLLQLNYIKNKFFCIDDVFKHNGLPYYDLNGELVV